MDFYKACRHWILRVLLIVIVVIVTFMAHFGIHLKSFSKEESAIHWNQTLEILNYRTDAVPEKTKLPPFLKRFKSPCWIERNMYDWKTGLRCLPYFYLVGMPKCGTTDFYSRITNHPSISNKSKKETHWFSRRRFNSIGKSKRLSKYLKYYNRTVKEDVLNSNQSDGIFNGIFGDFSSTYWDNSRMLLNWTGKKGTDPPYTLADVIYNLNPSTKIIFLLRNPVERIYSEYLYFKKSKKKSADDFHAKIKAAIQRHWYCLKRHCLRYCSYFYVNEGIRLEVSIYYVYVEDYLRVFPRSQVKIVKTDNFSTNMKTVVTDVFRFLDVEMPSQESLTTICSLRKKNTNKEKYVRTGPMLPATNLLLSDFYKRHNEKLSLLLKENIDFG